MKGTDTLNWQFLYLGFATMFGWCSILPVLESLSLDEIFTSNFKEIITLFYGMAMAVVLLPLIFIDQNNRIPKTPRACIGGGLMFLSLALIGLCGILEPRSMITGISLVCLLGVGSALVQGFYFSEAASLSGDAISKFSFGQSLAGLVCFPLFLGLKEVAGSYTDSVMTFVAAAVVAGSIPVYVFRVRGTLALKEQSASLSAAAQAPRAYSAIIGDIWPMTVCLFVNFALLFIVFPGHIIRWSETSKLQGDSFIQLGLFVYNLADTAGRYLVSNGVKLNRVGVVSVTAARLVPLGLWYVATFSHVGFLANDFSRLAILIVFTVMQGLAVTWAFILAPAKITIASEQPIVGNINTLALVLGIMVGGALINPMDSLLVKL